MSSGRARTLAWCLAALLLAGSAAAQTASGPPPGPAPLKDRSGDVLLGDGGGSELPGPKVAAPKSGPPASQLEPGAPGAPTLTPGSGGGGGVVTPPDDGGDGGDGGGKDPPDGGGDGTTPGGDPPPDDSGDDSGDDTTPGGESPADDPLGADSAAGWRVHVTRRGTVLWIGLEGATAGSRFALRWQIQLPRLDRR